LFLINKKNQKIYLSYSRARIKKSTFYIKIFFNINYLKKIKFILKINNFLKIFFILFYLCLFLKYEKNTKLELKIEFSIFH
jgi:hypothetical protein